MTVYNILSLPLLNRDATPKVLTDAYYTLGSVTEAFGYVQSNGSADGAGTTYRLVSVPSKARVSSLDFQASALGSGAAISVGVYYPTFIPVGSGISSSSASAAINTNIFVAALGCSAATASTNLITTANMAINLQAEPLWQIAGLTSDPGIDLDIVAYVSTAIATQGYVALRARYQF